MMILDVQRLRRSAILPYHRADKLVACLPIEVAAIWVQLII
jgi:hypothetical protein